MSLFIIGFIFMCLLAILTYYLVSKYLIKISAFIIDFILVGFYIYFSTINKLDTIYRVILSIVGVLVYRIILILMNRYFQTVGKILNYIVSFISAIGAMVAFWLFLEFSTSFLAAFKIIDKVYHRVLFTSDILINNIIHYILVFFISILIFKFINSLYKV